MDQSSASAERNATCSDVLDAISCQEMAHVTVQWSPLTDHSV